MATFNLSAPIKWLMDEIDETLLNGVQTAAGAISSAIMPLVSVCFGIYIILILINYWRGAEQEPVIDFMLRCVSFAIIIGFGLNADFYVVNIFPIVKDLGSDIAGVISGSFGGSAGVTPLDNVLKFYFSAIQDAFENMSFWNQMTGGMFFLGLKTLFIVLGILPLLIGGTIVIVIAKVSIAMIAMVAPIFFAFLLFPATRQYFSAWLNTALSYSFVPIFVAVVVGISCSISLRIYGNPPDLNSVNFVTVFAASVVNLILYFLIKQSTSLASSLSAGGINMSMGAAGNLGGMAGTAARMAANPKGMAMNAMNKLMSRPEHYRKPPPPPPAGGTITPKP